MRSICGSARAAQKAPCTRIITKTSTASCLAQSSSCCCRPATRHFCASSERDLRLIAFTTPHASGTSSLMKTAKATNARRVSGCRGSKRTSIESRKACPDACGRFVLLCAQAMRCICPRSGCTAWRTASQPSQSTFGTTWTSTRRSTSFRAFFAQPRVISLSAATRTPTKGATVTLLTKKLTTILDSMSATRMATCAAITTA
mmetsp:Transcript_13234/g.35595  ORF Transcript_13234/g.35595 Transcript_13234/m.35595 type:complete len:202 (-) Transcript_13234:376-981(-)